MSILERVRMPNARPLATPGRKMTLNAESIEESPSKEPKPAGFSNRERFRTAFRMKAYTLRQSSDGRSGCQHQTFRWCSFRQPTQSAVSLEGGALAEPPAEERGFPPEILLEEMIPTLKLVIRAVRSEHHCTVKPFTRLTSELWHV